MSRCIRRDARATRALSLALAGLMLLSQCAHAAPVVEDLRPLLRAALDAEDGQARGTLAGPLAASLRRHGIADTPLEVEVRVVNTYHEPGCARLAATFRQAGVRVGDAVPADRSLVFALDYCRDGAPPRSRE
jgi:hypothetical protein